MALDINDVKDTKIDTSFLTRKAPKTKSRNDVKRSYAKAIPSSETKVVIPSSDPKRTSKTRKNKVQTNNLTFYSDLHSRLEERSIKFLLLLESASTNKTFSFGQQDLLSILKVSSRPGLRKFMDLLLQKKMISIEQEFDAGRKTPRVYKILYTQETWKIFDTHP